MTPLRKTLRRGIGALAVTLTAGGGALALAPALAHASVAPHTSSYTFTELNDQADPTFNQLLGINDKNVISGYFGSGQPGHPNQGYLLDPPYAQSNYVNENYPGAHQTQVVALNNLGDTAGFYVHNTTQRGFVEWNGVFESFTDPNTPMVKGSVNQLLGINNKGVAVGFYNDANGNSHAYEVNQATGVFTAIKISGSTSTTATGINNNGDITGFATKGSVTYSWLLKAGGQVITLQYPNGSDTEAFGLNKNDEIVGTYLDAGGVQHGFTLKDPSGPVSHWQSIDDPNGPVGDTFVNGLNDAGDLVGFWCPSATACNGFLATP